MAYQPPQNDRYDANYQSYPDDPSHAQEEHYNPYSTHQSPYQDQDQDHDNDHGYTGYRDEAFVPPAAARDLPVGAGLREKGHRSFAMDRSTSSADLTSFRRDEHPNVWTKGTRGRCFGRFFCCTLMTAFLLIVGIILTGALWIRPPNITFNGVVFAENATKVSVITDGFTINLQLNISVSNPNFFSATFSNISAIATYPLGNSTNIGGGSLSNVNFASHSTDQVVLFPFTVQYTESEDPGFKIAEDIAAKCGFPNGTPGDITVNYVLTLKIRIIAQISPSFSSSASFPCPLTAAELGGLAGGFLGGSTT